MTDTQKMLISECRARGIRKSCAGVFQYASSSRKFQRMRISDVARVAEIIKVTLNKKK